MAHHWCLSTWSYHAGAEPAPVIACEQKIDFNFVELVCKSLHGPPLPYQSDDCQLVTDVWRRHLRFSVVYMCALPRTQSQIGDWSLSVSGPRPWSNLPTEIRRRESPSNIIDDYLTVRADMSSKRTPGRHFSMN